MLRTLYKDDDRFVETYWDALRQGDYLVGDAARKDEDGYFWIIGRIDDVINVSGHRMSTAEVESAIVSHEKVAEAAVIGQQTRTPARRSRVRDARGRPRGRRRARGEIREHVAKRIGKLARPKRIIWADDLPKTRSGKIMRRLLRDIAEGRELGDVTTLRDPHRWLGSHNDSEAVVHRRVTRYRELVADGSTITPAVRRAVAGAAARVPVAIVSGASAAEIRPVVAAAGLEPSFAAIVTSDDVRHGKPHPEGYEIALRRLAGRAPGLQPADVTVLEDTEAGVAAAKAAGMRCIAVGGTLRPDRLAAADEIVPAVDEALIERILR
jgi:HAD superfamily hydrolase (TIGR01509 family)